MAHIETERTLIVGNSKLSVEDETWFKLKNTLDKDYWIYARVIWINDLQIKIKNLVDDKGYILLPNSILEVSDKKPY